MSKIGIFGIGAIGSHLAMNLAIADKDLTIVIVDFDVIEDRNIGVHAYLSDQVGMMKTIALSFLLQMFGRDVVCSTYEYKTGDLASDYDLVIDCFDNFESRNMLADEAKQKKIPCLHIAFSQQKTFIVHWDERYDKMDKAYPADVCDMPGARGFITMVTGIASSVVLYWLKTGEKIGFFGNEFRLVKEK